MLVATNPYYHVLLHGSKNDPLPKLTAFYEVSYTNETRRREAESTT